MNTELFRDMERAALEQGVPVESLMAQWMAVQRALQEGRTDLAGDDIGRELRLLREPAN